MNDKPLDALRFLIVEDEEFQRDALELLLSNFGATKIMKAENGRVALDLLDATDTPIDIILCDINMPDMDGMAFLRNLANSDSNTSVILVSALGNALLDSVAVMGKAYGAKILGTMPYPPSRSRMKTLIANREVGAVTRKAHSERDPIPESEIVAALKLGEFIPYFQPKVEVDSGKVVGMEALVRWASPSRGLLAPGAFLDDVESAGLMDAMTFVMLTKSAAVCQSWRDRGLPLSVSVNLSLSNLGHAGLAERLHEAATHCDLAPSSILLEITESAAMSSVGPCIENLARLRLLGFGLSLDDYGTGYSSLQQLTRVPFTELKIDQSFVQDALHHETTRIVIESTMDLARRLGLKVTAEGVETVEHWEMLSQLGCDLAQGYLIAKPMPHEAIADWLGQWRISALRSTTQRHNSERQKLDILLVEDENFQLEAYGELLAQLELGLVHTATNLDGALKILAENPVDLVISDVKLDRHSGLDLVKLIRTQQTQADPATRIILLSAYRDQDIVLKSIVLDINGFLAKPARSSTLLDAIQNAMSEDYQPQPPSHYRELSTAALSNDRLVSDLTSTSEETWDDAGGAPIVVEHISLTFLRAGMILAEPLFNRQNLMILTQGSRLTTSIINRLQDLRESLSATRIKVIRPEALLDQTPNEVATAQDHRPPIDRQVSTSSAGRP